MANSADFTENDDPFSLPNPPLPEALGSSGHTTEPFEHFRFKPNTAKVKQVWAVGGGKGGVGKSLIASSLAISLARTGNRVVGIDLDLGGANLHTALGIDLPRRTLSDFISGKVHELSQCLSPTGIPNLEIISGAQDNIQITQISNMEKFRLMQASRELVADYVIYDLGAGTAAHTLDFFIYSDIGMLVLLPEPTSIENVYRFIKSAYYRRLRLCPRLSEVHYLIEQAMDQSNTLGIKTPSDLFREVNKVNAEAGMMLKEEIGRFQPKVIVNQARTQTDIDIGFSVKSVCKKYFGIEMDYVGYLDYDSAVWQSIRRKRPLMLEFPNSRLVSNIERISQYILKRHANSRNSLL